MTTLVKYHKNTNNIALFESDGQYWIGAYGPHLTHQNGEPMFYLIRGYFTEEDTASAELDRLTGNEF